MLQSSLWSAPCVSNEPHMPMPPHSSLQPFPPFSQKPQLTLKKMSIMCSLSSNQSSLATFMWPASSSPLVSSTSPSAESSAQIRPASAPFPKSGTHSNVTPLSRNASWPFLSALPRHAVHVSAAFPGLSQLRTCRPQGGLQLVFEVENNTVPRDLGDVPGRWMRCLQAP